MTLSRSDSLGTRRLLEDRFDVLNPHLDLQSGEDKVSKEKWSHLKNMSNTREAGNMGTSRGYTRCNSGKAYFNSSGLNDLTLGGSYSGAAPLQYKVQIDGTGSPDTFKWSDDGGATWDATTVAITGAAQTLNNGLTVTFGATTGHTSGDNWSWTSFQTTSTIDGIYTFYKDTSTTERLFVRGGRLCKVTNNWDAPTFINDHATSLPLALTAGHRVMFTSCIRTSIADSQIVPVNMVALVNQTEGLYLYDGTDATHVDIPKSGGGGNITGARFVLFHPSGRLCVSCNFTDTGQANTIYWSRPGDIADFVVGTVHGGYSTLYQGRSSLICSGLGYIGDDLLAWTEVGFFRIRDWNKYDESGNPLVPDTKEIAGEGCIAPQSIQLYRGYWVWVSRNGVFAWNGGLPRNMSRDIFPGAAYSFNAALLNLLNVFAVVTDDQYRLTYNNLDDSVSRNSRTLIYDFKTEGWFQRENTPFKCGTACTGGGDRLQQVYYGSHDATKPYIWRWGDCDNRNPVPAGLQQKTVYLDDFAPTTPQAGDSIAIEAKTGWQNFGSNSTMKRLECVEIEYDYGNGGGSVTPAVTNGRIYFYTDDNETVKGYITIPDTKKFQRLYFPMFQIQAETFTGSGLDDMSVSGAYTGSLSDSYVVKIDAVGTPDTFKWSRDAGTTWVATGVAITGAVQTLEQGITVTFAATTGHTVNDLWTIPIGVNLYCRKYKLMFSATCTNKQITFKRFAVYAKAMRSIPDTT